MANVSKIKLNDETYNVKDAEARKPVDEELAKIRNEGSTQVSEIDLKGQEVLESIPEEYAALSGDVSALKSALTLTNEIEGNIIDLGQNWSIRRNNTTIEKTHNNTFTFSGTHTGAYQYVILSSNNGKAFSNTNEVVQSDFTIKLIPGRNYKIIYEKLSEHAIENSNVWFRLYRMVDNEMILMPGTEIFTTEFADTAIVEKQFIADTDSYALMANLRSLEYSGTFRMYLVDAASDNAISTLTEKTDLLEEKNDTLNSIVFKEKLSIKYATTIGGIGDDGNNENATRRARSGDAKYLITAPTLIKKSSTDYAYNIMIYDKDGIYQSGYEDGYIEADEYILQPGNDSIRIRLQFQSRPYRAITSDDLPLINNLLTFYTIKDSVQRLENETATFAAQRGLPETADTKQYYPAFVHVTDIHEDGIRFMRAMELADRIGAVGVFGTGDFVNYLTDQAKVSYLIEGVSKSKTPFYPCSGNHEQISNTQLEPSEWIFQPLQEQGGYTLANVTNPTYWHKDLDDLKIRLIAVNQFEDSPSQWIYNITQTQIDWLCPIINSTPEGYGIIVLRHTSEKPIRRSATVEKFCEKDSANPYLMNTITTDIVDAYISGTTINKTYPLYGEAELSDDTVTVNYDFSAKNINTEFICFCDGHFHRDYVHYEYQTNNTIVDLNCTCTALMAYGGDLARIDGSPTQDAFNVYIIDQDRKVIKIVRVGSHLNYNFSTDRNYLEIPYNANPDQSQTP